MVAGSRGLYQAGRGRALVARKVRPPICPRSTSRARKRILEACQAEIFDNQEGSLRADVETPAGRDLAGMLTDVARMRNARDVTAALGRHAGPVA